MQLDTGAQTSVGRAELEYLGVEYRIQEPCPGFNGWADACIATVPELGFGTVTRRDFRIVIHGPSLTAASRRELDHQLSEAKTQSTVPLKVGSLGADFFAGQSLYLDLSTSKAGILTNRAAISGATCSFTLLNNRIVLQLTGDVPLTALYDTGASPFAIMVRPATFAGLTGLSLDSASVQHVTVKSWGDEIVVHATDIPLQLRAGDVTLDLQRVHTSELVEQFYQGCGGKADALLGNEAFRGKVLLINFARKTLTVADPLR
jgi:hypothetical protein